ncbi:hypothetical protein MNBD_GAMMA12-3748 [hydrothermal vent metagenome]|uniref:Negative regulator of flagellin synthesis n=1 Tax=hydrothermal vent metagenome TaxID=652676 RepID=A0A3B0XZW9_9ZZZZ
MAIEIGSNPSIGVNDAGNSKRTETDKQKQTSNEQTPTTSTNTDSVRLTQSGKQLSELASRIDNIPSVDSDKVDAIKKAIANGDYEIDAERIASKLTNFESLLP